VFGFISIVLSQNIHSVVGMIF